MYYNDVHPGHNTAEASGLQLLKSQEMKLEECCIFFDTFLNDTACMKLSFILVIGPLQQSGKDLKNEKIDHAAKERHG